MFYETYDNYKSLSHLIYLDNNIFRKLIRDKEFENNFFNYFETHYPNIFDNFNYLFTWPQFLEAIDLGQIKNEIKKSGLWKISIEGKSKEFFKRKPIPECLDIYFTTTRTIILEMECLQKNKLFEKIDEVTSFAHSPNSIIFKYTLKKVKTFIENETYLDHLADQLAWEFLTSLTFISSKHQWKEREQYFDSLIALWHKLYKN